jgi:hypothetical protein
MRLFPRRFRVYLQEFPFPFVFLHPGSITLDKQYGRPQPEQFLRLAKADSSAWSANSPLSWTIPSASWIEGCWPGKFSESTSRPAGTETVLLADCLARLPTDYREVVILRHLEGFPFLEVAQRMGRTVDSVKKLWARALAQLREFLGEVA